MTRKDFGQKQWFFPMPVLMIATYDEEGNPDVMNAAWGMISDYDEISISMGEHKTTDNLAKTHAFTVSLATEDMLKACDYAGIESGRKEPNKFAKTGFHAVKSEKVNAPIIEELPLTFECKERSFENGILVGEIVNVSCDEAYLKDGKPDLSKIKPITFNPIDNTYNGIGEAVGHAFKDGMELK